MSDKEYGPRLRHGAYVGGREAPEHYVWRSMLARCNNPKTASFKYYGAKGVKVCKRWLKYENFFADMGPRPAPGYSIDRRNVAGDYKPSNCTWATRSEQQSNKSSTKLYTNGKFKGTLTECAAYLGITKHCAFERWKNWNSFEKGIVWRQLQRPV